MPTGKGLSQEQLSLLTKAVKYMQKVRANFEDPQLGDYNGIDREYLLTADAAEREQLIQDDQQALLDAIKAGQEYSRHVMYMPDMVKMARFRLEGQDYIRHIENLDLTRSIKHNAAVSRFSSLNRTCIAHGMEEFYPYELDSSVALKGIAEEKRPKDWDYAQMRAMRDEVKDFSDTLERLTETEDDKRLIIRFLEGQIYDGRDERGKQLDDLVSEFEAKWIDVYGLEDAETGDPSSSPAPDHSAPELD